MKKCFKCGHRKPRAEFYAHPRMADGLLGKCKTCAREDVRTNRQRRAGQYRRYEARRAQQPERKVFAATSQRLHRSRHPDRAAARRMVGNERRAGRLRPRACEVCGSTFRVEGHHRDYARPLEVAWLCFRHHRQEHGQLLAS